MFQLRSKVKTQSVICTLYSRLCIICLFFSFVKTFLWVAYFLPCLLACSLPCFLPLYLPSSVLSFNPSILRCFLAASLPCFLALSLSLSRYEIVIIFYHYTILSKTPFFPYNPFSKQLRSKN